MKKRFSLLTAFVIGCIVSMLALTALQGRVPVLLPGAESRSRQTVLTALTTTPPPGPRIPTTNFVADAVAKVEPAVVDVHTQGKAITMPGNPFFADPFFRRFLGPTDRGNGGERVVPRGAGSGVIISPDGYILTNNHVVARADKVTVKVGEKGYDARVVGTDDASDIAVVKIDPKGKRLPVATLGNSDKVRVGDWAVAVGNPLDVGTTVTLGIISAVNRTGMSAEGHALNSVIQTDAAINPGNSGGALANIEGQVIAINEAIASPTGAYVGIGFAIPINAARKIAAELIKNGKIVRPYLGVAYAPIKSLPPEARRQVGIPLRTDEGAVITQVYPGSPAEKAGLRIYDVVLEANRRKITDTVSLSELIEKLKVGDTLALLVNRIGRNRLLTATLGERPPRFGETPARPEDQLLPSLP